VVVVVVVDVVLVVEVVVVVVVVGSVVRVATSGAPPDRSERVFHQNVAAWLLFESCACCHLYVPLHVPPFVTVNSPRSIAWSSPSKKPGCLQTPTTSMPGATFPWVTPSSTSPDGQVLPIVKVLLNWLYAIDPDVEFDPVAATRGAAVKSQSRIRVLAAVSAAAWFASPLWSIALWQNEPYFCPCDGRYVCPGAGVMSRPSAQGLACASYGSDPSLQPVHAAGEQLAHDVSMSARLFFATQSPASRPSTRPAYSHQPLPGAQDEPKPEMASPFLHAVSKLVGPATL